MPTYIFSIPRVKTFWPLKKVHLSHFCELHLWIFSYSVLFSNVLYVICLQVPIHLFKIINEYVSCAFSESLPNDIGRLSKLESVSVVSNLLTFVPESMSQLKHLKSVILRYVYICMVIICWSIFLNSHCSLCFFYIYCIRGRSK